MSTESELDRLASNTSSACTLLAVIMFAAISSCCTLTAIHNEVSGIRQDLKALHPTSAPR